MQFRPRSFITADELSERWRGLVCTKTLAEWRWKQTGPRFFKPGGKVLYRLDHVEAWEELHMEVMLGKASLGFTEARLGERVLYDATLAEDWCRSAPWTPANDDDRVGTYW